MIIINGSFLINKMTGVERYATEILKKFPSSYNGHELLLISPRNSIVEREFSFRVVNDKWKLNGQRWLWEQTRLPILLRNYSKYILWSPANTGPYIIKNQVLTIHDVAFLKDKDWFSASNRTYYRMLIPSLAKKINHILTVSHFSKNELIKHGVPGQNKVDVVYNSSSDIFRNNTKKRNLKKYFVTIGSRDPRKNVGVLIKAWKILNEKIDDFPKLKIIGKGNSGFKKENISEIPNNVEFTGYLSDDDMINLLRDSQALIFPSLYEGFGLPPLEAMSLGVPIICSDIDPLKEVCGEAPIYFNPLDVNDIVEKIETFINNSSKSSEMISLGFRRAELFSWEKSAEKLLSILTRVK